MSRAPRIVSLLPAATEILCQLGGRDCLVGRSHECDFPPDVRCLPACTRTLIDPTASSADIHAAVKLRTGAGDELYQVDQPLLLHLAPDFILTQAQCEVCAVGERSVQEALAGWVGPRPRVVALGATRLAGLWEDFAHLASALGWEDRLRAATGPLKQRVVSVIEQAELSGRRPTIACLEWYDPLMVSGNWVPELGELAGARVVLGQAGRPSHWITWEALAEADPEMLVLMPCGFELDRALAEVAVLEGSKVWRGLRAVRSARVYAVDGNAHFNRPGPRLVDSLEILAGIVRTAGTSSGAEAREHWRAVYPSAGTRRILAR